MSDTFAVGEVAVYWRPVSEWHGTEVAVISMLQESMWRREVPPGRGIGWGYDVEWPDGEVTFQTVDELRKRHPPQDWTKLCQLEEAPVEELA